MEITKNIPVTIKTAYHNTKICDWLCDNFIDDKCQDFYYCHYGKCELETIDNDTFRCEQCLTDFGV